MNKVFLCSVGAAGVVSLLVVSCGKKDDVEGQLVGYWEPDVELFIEYWKKEHEARLQEESPEDLARLVKNRRDEVLKSHTPLHIPEKGTLLSIGGEKMSYTVTSVDSERGILSTELDIGGQQAPAEITVGEGKFQVWCQCEECLEGEKDLLMVFVGITKAEWQERVVALKDKQEIDESEGESGVVVVGFDDQLGEEAAAETPRAKKKETANTENSNNMAAVLMELQTYMHRSRKKAFPATLEELELIDVAGKRSKILFMQCEDGKLRPWVYVAGVVPQKDAERIILHSPKEEAGERMVGLSDGSVRTMAEAAFQAMLEKQVTAQETEVAETEPAETEPAETEPTETEPTETEPTETEPTETEPTEDSETPAKVPLAGVWTNKSGKKIEAALLGLEGDRAVLRMANGKTYRYPIDSLDAESQKRVREFAAARED